MAKMITAIIVKGKTPVNTIVLSDENAADWFANFDGKTVVLDTKDDFGTEFITLTGCVAVDVTGMDPMPGVNNGWVYDKGAWIPPVIVNPESE